MNVSSNVISVLMTQSVNMISGSMLLLTLMYMRSNVIFVPTQVNLENNLNEHKLVHSDERKFKCNLCSYDTKRKRDLRNHARTHDDVYAFKCGSLLLQR